MLRRDNLSYYVVAFLLYIILKLAYSIADLSALKWLIQPINFLFSLFTNSSWIFLENQGYFHEHYNMIINKSCAGGNFLIISFTMLLLLWVHRFKTHIHKILFLLLAFITSYVFTIFVNTSRIVILSKIESIQIIRQQLQWTHEAFGSFIYLFFLILMYHTSIIIFKLINPPHEKSL